MKAIVLSKIKYGETSIIAKVYTEELGLVSFMIKGVYNKKNKLNANYFQPLYLLNITFDYNPKHKIQYIKELSVDQPLITIHSDIRKSSIAIFITELLTNLICESEQNTELFCFIRNSIIALDNKPDNFSSSHIIFALKISKYLGFYPQNNYSEKNRYFNLQEGCFVSFAKADESNYIHHPFSKTLSDILKTDDENYLDYRIDSSQRTIILDKILHFYALHIESFRPMKSHHIMHTIFSK